MTRQAALIVLLINALMTSALIAAHARWIAPAHTPRMAVLDVAELYRLKEHELTSALMKPDAKEAERADALKRAHAFGTDVSTLIAQLPTECDCMIVARGAVVGSPKNLRDLTPLVRQRLGL